VKDKDLVSVFCMLIPSFHHSIFEEAVFSPSCVLGSFVKDDLAIDVWVYVHMFYSDPLVFLSVFVLIPSCFYCYGSVVYFEVRYCDASNIGCFAQNCFGYSRSFVFLYVLQETKSPRQLYRKQGVYYASRLSGDNFSKP
jgi:hypothetical protein